MNLDPLFKFRATGRSTRMLEDVVFHLKNGRNVIIMGGYSRNNDHLARLLTRIYPEVASFSSRERTLRFNNGSSVKFLSADHPDWIWELMCLRGAPKDTPTYVDHYALELRYPHVIGMWAKWC